MRYTNKQSSKFKYAVLGLVIFIGLLLFFRSSIINAFNSNSSNLKTSTLKKNNSNKTTTGKIVSVTKPAINQCASNQLAKLVLVSISARHLWACSYQTIAYNSPVVTGMDYLAADLTPVGTYHIESMQTNLYLKGSDSTGSWDDYVHYWMQFLYNQYGAYGLHDATWRPANAFGNISPNSSNASHGCVELPLATATWLYNWVQLGTTVQIES